MPRFLRACLFASVLATAFAAAAPATVPLNSPVLGEWLPAASAAVLVAFMISGVAYMIGTGFRFSSLTEWSKTEFWEAFLSVLMLGAVFFIVSLLATISTSLTGQPDQVRAGFAFLDTVETRIVAIAITSLAAIQVYAYAASLTATFFIPIPLIPIPFLAILYARAGLSISPFSGLEEVISGIDPLFNLLWGAWFAVWAQRALLVFVQNHALATFLPLGLICRALPITRRIGGTIIAVALALYFVYPLGLALSLTIMGAYPMDAVSAETSLVSPWSLLTFELGGLLTAQNVSSLIPVIAPIVINFVLVVVLTVLNFIITMTAFRAIAKHLGGDPEILGVGKLGL